jgi:hypothetical protein
VSDPVTPTIPKIADLRRHSTPNLARDRAILDLLELIQLDMVPGVVTVAGLMALWRCCLSQANRRLRAINALPGWRVQRESGPYACIWVGPCLQTAPPRPLSTRQRWERVREALRGGVDL